MRKTFRFIAAALAISAAASCQKELPVVPELQEYAFSASIAVPADTKAAIEDDGIFKFTAGDYIYVFNNNTSSNIDINRYNGYTEEEGKFIRRDLTETSRIVAERIQITDAMLSDGGRVVNFSTVVSAPGTPASEAKCYHFLYISSDANADYNATASRNDDNRNYASNSTVYRKQSPYTASTRKVFCYSRSNSNSGELKFYHFDSQLKFKVSNTADFDKVTIEARGAAGVLNCINPDVNFYPGRVNDFTKEYTGSNISYSENSVSTTDPTKNGILSKGCIHYTRNANGSSDVININLSGDAASTYYVALPLLYTYENGIVFKLWKSGSLVKTLEAKQAITPAAAGVINFGDLASLKTYTSYYAMWTDGKPFKIGGTTVNPTSEPYASMNPIYVESDCNISSITGWTNTNNIYFIKEGVTLTINDAKYWNDAPATLYIIGEKIGTKSNVVWQKTLAPRGGAVALKNLNITSCIPNSVDSEGKLSSCFIMDGCRIVLPEGEFATATNGASSGWNSIELMNNDFIYTAAKNSKLMKVLPTAAYNFFSLVIINNQSYTSDGVMAGDNSCLIWDYWQGRVSYQHVDIENNTFVNCAHNYNVVYCAAQGVPVGGDLVIKNNINYVDGPAKGYAKLFLLADANKTGVNISASNNYAWATSGIANLQVWGNVSCTPFSADPFASKDFANGRFVLTSAAASVASGCGAKR